MHIYLLTHPRELDRKTNTGQLILETFKEQATKIVWERKAPDAKLLDLIETGNAALLYPNDQSELLGQAKRFENYIIIDSTWQEAKKIYNHSPYLHKLPHIKVALDRNSIYHLRRNQRCEGLSTAELVIELCRFTNSSKMADTLQAQFDTFLQA